MSLVLRGDIGRKLTVSEMDGNFTYLEGLSGGGSTGGYQVLGSLVVDLTLATQSLTYPIIYVVTTDGDPQFNEGDIVNGSPNGVDILERLRYILYLLQYQMRVKIFQFTE